MKMTGNLSVRSMMEREIGKCTFAKSVVKIILEKIIESNMPVNELNYE